MDMSPIHRPFRPPWRVGCLFWVPKNNFDNRKGIERQLMTSRSASPPPKASWSPCMHDTEQAMSCSWPAAQTDARNIVPLWPEQAGSSWPSSSATRAAASRSRPCRCRRRCRWGGRLTCPPWGSGPGTRRRTDGSACVRRWCPGRRRPATAQHRHPPRRRQRPVVAAMWASITAVPASCDPRLASISSRSRT
jgi:hypothetical protein